MNVLPHLTQSRAPIDRRQVWQRANRPYLGLRPQPLHVALTPSGFEAPATTRAPRRTDGSLRSSCAVRRRSFVGFFSSPLLLARFAGPTTGDERRFRFARPCAHCENGRSHKLQCFTPPPRLAETWRSPSAPSPAQPSAQRLRGRVGGTSRTELPDPATPSSPSRSQPSLEPAGDGPPDQHRRRRRICLAGSARKLRSCHLTPPASARGSARTAPRTCIAPWSFGSRPHQDQGVAEPPVRWPLELGRPPSRSTLDAREPTTPLPQARRAVSASR